MCAAAAPTVTHPARQEPIKHSNSPSPTQRVSQQAGIDEMESQMVDSLPVPGSANVSVKRTKLSAKQVLAIYEMKAFHGSGQGNQKVTTHRIARNLGVSEKTIRDIWSRRTWKLTTSDSNVHHSSVSVCLPHIFASWNQDQVATMSPMFDHHIFPHLNYNQVIQSPTVLNYPSDDSISIRQCEKASDSQGMFELPTSSNPSDPFHDDWPFSWE